MPEAVENWLGSSNAQNRHAAGDHDAHAQSENANGKIIKDRVCGLVISRLFS